MAENLTSESFKTKVFDYEKKTEWEYAGDLPAIVDFYAQWCGPCKMLSPVLERLAQKFAGKLHVYKVDTDAEAEISRVFGIQSVPTLYFIPKEGKPSYAMGALPQLELERVITEVLKVEA
jgi:thioredoxin